MIKNRSHYLFIFFLLYSSVVFASDANFNNTTQLPIIPNAAGNVGIGSANPGQALDVQGTVRALLFSGNGSGLTNLTGANYWLNNSGANVGISTAYAVGIGTSFVGGTGEGALSVMNGNVGIGTWKPAYLLDLNLGPTGVLGLESSPGSNPGTIQSAYGNILFSSNAYFNGSDWIYIGTGAVSQFQAEGSSGNAYILTAPSGPAGSIANVTQRLTVTNGGNVGIGSVVPNASLEVLAPPSAGDENVAMFSANIGAGSSAHLLINNTAGASNYSGALDFASQGSYMWEFGNDWFGIGDQDLYFYDMVAHQMRMFINSSGNVGIGSIAPSETLDVQGTVRMLGFNIASGAGAGKVLTSDASGNGTWGAAGAGSNYWLYDTGNIGINTANAVGIGTISQINKLNVLGNIGIGTFSYDPYMTKAAPNGGMIISGNVGIGTWVPGNSLAVAGNIGIGTAYNIVGNGTTSTILTLRTDTSSIYAGWLAGAQTTAGSLDNVAVGYNALTTNNNGNNNVAVGSFALSVNTGSSNTAVGQNSLGDNIGGTENAALGTLAGTLTSSSANNSASSTSLYLGYDTESLASGDTNEIVIGANAVGNGSNTVTLGNTSVVSTILEGNVGVGTTFVGAAGEAALSVMNGSVGIGTWASRNQLEVKGGNVGIGTSLGGAMMTIGGSCAAHQGTGVCFGKSTNGITCLGYCTAGAWPNCTTCNCC